MKLTKKTAAVLILAAGVTALIFKLKKNQHEEENSDDTDTCGFCGCPYCGEYDLSGLDD